MNVTKGQAPASQLDHLVWAAPDLPSAVEHMEALCGVRAAEGGRHPGVGTHNALLSLGPGRYLELVAPDPSQDTLRGFGLLLADLGAPSLLTWSAATADIATTADIARAQGWTCQGPRPMSRALPGGGQLHWQILFITDHPFGHCLPFFIEWEGTSHPSSTTPRAGALASLTLRHPQPDALIGALGALGLAETANTELATEPGLRAEIEGRRGPVILT